ncbi:hypothetical protein AB0M43_37245 [Longispora sp. NPDC051575]|uniref:hypothetical protein n=1 Tax=Longispora sp. NPDC051575 TaxID=3154943 RepID=UPI003435BB2A
MTTPTNPTPTADASAPVSASRRSPIRRTEPGDLLQRFWLTANAPELDKHRTLIVLDTAPVLCETLARHHRDQPRRADATRAAVRLTAITTDVAHLRAMLRIRRAGLWWLAAVATLIFAWVNVVAYFAFAVTLSMAWNVSWGWWFLARWRRAKLRLITASLAVDDPVSDAVDALTAVTDGLDDKLGPPCRLIAALTARRRPCWPKPWGRPTPPWWDTLPATLGSILQPLTTSGTDRTRGQR